MPRGKYVNHKGRSRHFTNPEELEQQRREEAQKAWRKKRDQIGSDSEEDEDEKDKEEEAGASGGKQKAAGDSESSSGSEDESDEDGNKKKKGVEGLIEIENPNRIVKKEKKVTKVAAEAAEGGAEQKPELSRREREELEKQRARAHYQKLHAEGKTDEARADLARLALIRKQREEAAKKREEEKLAKEAQKSAKVEATGKALGKKSS